MMYSDYDLPSMTTHSMRTLRTPTPAKHLLPAWCWWLVVLLSYGDIATTLIGKRLGIVERNPLYAHAGSVTLPWLLVTTHAALLLLLALIARLHRRVGIVGALAMSLLFYLPAVVINTALILVVLHR